VMGDPPPGKSGWSVKVLGQVKTLANAGVSTSGDEFQFIELGGVRYSHIVDPRTGMALRNSHTVAVIAKTGIDSDSIATAVCVAGQAIADKLIAKRGVQILFDRQ
jgi:thiamine biosynthesis lipoprotein